MEAERVIAEADTAQCASPEQQQDDLDDLMKPVRDLSRFVPLGILVAVLAPTTSGWTPHAIALVAALAVLGVLMLISTAVWMRRR